MNVIEPEAPTPTPTHVPGIISPVDRTVSVVEGDALLVGGHVISIVEIREKAVEIRVETVSEFDGFDPPPQPPTVDPTRRRRFAH